MDGRRTPLKRLAKRNRRLWVVSPTNTPWAHASASQAAHVFDNRGHGCLRQNMHLDRRPRGCQPFEFLIASSFLWTRHELFDDLDETASLPLAQEFLPIFCRAGTAQLPEHSRKVLLRFEAAGHGDIEAAEERAMAVVNTRPQAVPSHCKDDTKVSNRLIAHALVYGETSLSGVENCAIQSGGIVRLLE